MKNTILLASAALTALTFTACDSKQEQARESAVEAKADQLENTADVVRKTGDAKAEALEERAGIDGDPTEKAAEAKADALEEKADAVRETK